MQTLTKLNNAPRLSNHNNVSTFRTGVAAILLSILILSSIGFVVYLLHETKPLSSESYPESHYAGLGRLEKLSQKAVIMNHSDAFPMTQNWISRAYQSDSQVLVFATPEGLDVTDGVLGTIYIFSPPTEPDNIINISISPAERPPSSLSPDTDRQAIAQSYVDYYVSSTAYFGDLKPILAYVGPTELGELSGFTYHIYLDTHLSVRPRGVILDIFPQSSEQSLVVIDRSIDKDTSGKIISTIFLNKRGN